MDGRKFSIYIDNDTAAICKFVKKLCAERGESLSHFINNAIRDAYQREVAGIHVSEGAYCVMSCGRFDLLSFIGLPAVPGEKHKDVIVVDESVYKDGGIKALVGMMRDPGKVSTDGAGNVIRGVTDE